MDNNTVYGKEIVTNRDRYSTLPPRITALTAESGDGKAIVSFRAYTEEQEQWLSANAPYILVLKANTVPQSPADGMAAKINHVRGAMLSHTFTGLTNETVYYARVFPINFKGRAQSTLVDQVVSVVPMGMPSAATNLKVVGSGKSATCTWTNPTQSTFYRSVLVRKVGSAPTSITDGTELYRGTGTSYTVSNLELNTTYYFAVFAISSSGSYQDDFPKIKYTTPAYIEEVLYENGQDPSGLTGGFSAGGGWSYDDDGQNSTSNFTYSYSYSGVNCMQLATYGDGGFISTANSLKQIDITNVSAVQIIYSHVVSGTHGAWLNSGASIYFSAKRGVDDFPNVINTEYAFKNLERKGAENTFLTQTWDTTNLTGLKYLNLSCGASYSSNTFFRIKKIVIHKTK